MAYRRWRNISRDDLAVKSGVPKKSIEAIEEGKADIEEEMLDEIAPELTGHGLPLVKCEAYNRVYDRHVRSR
jgi:transcriptional regulator with XRE-family HTH domain